MEDCFAYSKLNKGCTALKEKECDNCNFYRTDLNRYQIEREILRYSPEGKKNDYEILLRK